MMHPVLRAAVDETAEAFGADTVAFAERPDGSVKVTVSSLDLGGNWEPRVVGIAAILLTTFPSPAPYPFYLPAGLRRADGGPVPNLKAATVDGVAVSQLSVRPLGGRTESSFPALILGVVSWLRDH
jgi:hypothetical protein